MKLEGTGSLDRLRSKIDDEHAIVLDGGVATELPHQHGQDEERLWGVEALASAPSAVLDMHSRYVDSGVDVLTTNTWGLPTVIAGDGQITGADGASLHWMEAARLGVQVARQAISDGGRAGECAVAFALNGDLDRPGGIETVALLARALKDDPPDVLVLETLSLLRPSLFDVIEALLNTELPLWLSFRRCLHGVCGVYGQHWGGPEGDAFGRAAHRFEDMGVGALLVNCIPPDHVNGMVSYLREFTDTPLGAYPNLGYYSDAGWHSQSEIGGAEYADLARGWRAEGAQIIGGCCGTRPEHIAAARDALADTRPGRQRRSEPNTVDDAGDPSVDDRALERGWTDRRDRSLTPLPFPAIEAHDGVPTVIPGTTLMWRHLFEQGVGAHQRCLDVGCGAGVQAVQLALNGCAHVHAIDIDERAVANTLDNAFRNDVDQVVTAEHADLFPWTPIERYEVIVANLPQVPVDPAAHLASHRPTDYWGRGLIDQVIAKLPDALAPEGLALLTVTSLLSQRRTSDLLHRAGFRDRVVAWEAQPLPDQYSGHSDHLAEVQARSDAFLVAGGAGDLLVTYVLEIRWADERPPALLDLG